MADTVRSRLLASDLGVLPVTTYASELGRFEVRSIQLRPYARNFELELRTCLEPRGDGANRIESTSVFELSPTGAMDHVLDRIELAPEAKTQFERALQFVGVHPYMPWGIYNLVSAMFPGAGMFPYESRLVLVDHHPTTHYDDRDSTADASPPTTLRTLPQHASWLRQTVRAGDRSAQLEHVELGLDDDTKYHFACSIRITGPDEDRRLYAAHCWFNIPAEVQLDAPIQPTAKAKLQQLLTEVLDQEVADLVPRVLDALLHPDERTWRDWVESGALGTLLQPAGFLAKATTDAVTLMLRSPRQHMGRGLDARSEVMLDLELHVETDGETSVLQHVTTLGGLEMLGDVPLKSTAFLERPSVARAASKYQLKVQRKLEALAKAWNKKSHEWTNVVSYLREDELLATLVSAHRAASTGAAPTRPAAHAATVASPPRAFTKGDKVSHKTFGVGTVVVVEKPGADGRLKIEFSSGTKVLASRFVELVRQQ